MQGRQEVRRRKEDTSALVLQEWQLVLAGKPADKLNEYIYEYEMDLLTNSLESNPGFIEKYTYGLLLTGDYLELSFFLARTKEVPRKAKLAQIAEAGKCEKLKELGAAINEYLAEIKDGKLNLRVKEQTISAILKILTKNFLNYKFSDLKDLFNVSEEEVRQLGYNIQNGYVELKKEEVHSDCLLTKLRELAVVAHKMNKFE